MVLPLLMLARRSKRKKDEAAAEADAADGAGQPAEPPVVETVEVPSEQPPLHTAANAYEGDADRFARYIHLRANVRRRRTWYGLFIVFALVVLAVSVADIVFLDSQLKWVAVFPAYILLFICAILLLFSRKRHAAEVEELRRLERSLLQCPDCQNVFRYGAVSWRDARRTAFSCPVCGVFSQLPDPGAPPVQVYLPKGEIRDIGYRCGNCGEELTVGTFTGIPLHEVKFRACPHCGVKGQVHRVEQVTAV